MPLHDCPWSFSELADRVLPELMASLSQRMRHAWSGSVLLESATLIPDTRGAYVWMLQGTPAYVGIANRMRRRIRDHLCGDPSRANLAVRVAARELDVPTTAVRRHPEFDVAFELAKKMLMEGEVAFLEIENPLVLYLFEPYCAMELDTHQFNRFDTLQILSPRPRQESRNA